MRTCAAVHRGEKMEGNGAPSMELGRPDSSSESPHPTKQEFKQITEGLIMRLSEGTWVWPIHSYDSALQCLMLILMCVLAGSHNPDPTADIETLMSWLSGSVQLLPEYRRYLVQKVVPKALRNLMGRRSLEDEYRVIPPRCPTPVSPTVTRYGRGYRALTNRHDMPGPQDSERFSPAHREVCL